MAIPQTIADELLPLIFRRRRQPMLGNDLPEQGGYSGNMLAPTQDPAPPLVVAPGAQPSNYALPEETRPRQVNHPALGPQPARPAGIPPNAHWDATGQNPDGGEWIVPGPTQAEPAPQLDTSAMRMGRRVETDKHGRPTPNIALQGDEQTLDYQGRLARMPEDKEGGGWWPRIRAAIAGFAAGGPVGAASAFGTRALREHFDPTLGSREYKAEKMGQNAPAVAQIRQARKDKLDEDSKVASTDLAKARTESLKNPRANGRIVERKDGVYIIDAKTGRAEKIAGIPAEAGTPGSTRYISRADGVYGINAEHPNGFKVSGIPGNAGKDVEDVSFGNSQIQSAIAEAQAEQKKIDEGLRGIPPTIQSTDILGNPRTVANPDYTYNMTRRRQLDDDIRNWRQKLKSPKKSAAKSEDPDIRAYADQYYNGDYAAAEAAASRP